MSETTPPTSRPDRRPLWALGAIVFVLTARWIWFAGIGDFGWTYEFGMRVMQGEVPYRDYVCTLPQLTSYTIIPFLILFKGGLWAFSVHLYLWWAASLLVGYLVAKRLELRPNAQAAAIFFAACLSLPALHLGHAYSYAATVFFGLAFLQLDRFRATLARRHLLGAGAWIGLCLFAKQNVGAAAVLFGGAYVAHVVWRSNRLGTLANSWLWLSTGFAITFLPPLLYLASHASLEEVFRQMFLDAGAGKGGARRMLFNLIPLWFFTPGTPHRHLISLAIGAIVTGSLVFWFKRREGRVANESLATAPENWRMIIWAIGVVGALSVLSTFDLPAVRSFFASLHPKAMYEFQGYTFPLIFLCYAFFTALTMAMFASRRTWSNRVWFPIVLTLAAILWGHELSSEGYLPLGAPLVVPLAAVVLERSGLLRNSVPLLCAAGLMMIVGLSISTQEAFLASSFKPLERLPEQTKFAGLWGHPTYVSRIRELETEVAPRIKDMRTLWITVGGPHLAWGGKSVFGPAAMHLDTYNLRAELVFQKRWLENPPDFIFVGFQTPVPGSQLFTTNALESWLPERYDRIWMSPVRPAQLWQLRPTTNSIAH